MFFNSLPYSLHGYTHARNFYFEADIGLGDGASGQCHLVKKFAPWGLPVYKKAITMEFDSDGVS